MRNLLGMEMVCFCKDKHFELVYEGGSYRDDKGELVDDVLDMNCYVCTASYYTTHGNPIPLCPNCGHIDRKRFDKKEQLTEFMRGQDWSWLKRNRLQAVMVHTWDGDWQLRITNALPAMEASGRYREIRKLS